MGTVVIGIIDDGIAFAHERFRTAPDQTNAPDETRVAYAWLQAVPSGGLYLDKTGIDGLFGTCTHGGVLDEDEFYQRAGWIDFALPRHWTAARRAAHGTHVMDLACGYARQDKRKDRPIVCVQLPTVVTADPGQALRSKYPIDAMTFILDRADQMARDAGVPYFPVVINFSYGAIAGPHDGTSEFEAKVDELVALRRNKFGPLALEVVFAAGNSHLSRCHAQHSFAQLNEVKSISWRVLPDNRAQSFLEIWMPCRTGSGSQSRLEVTVTSPTGESHTLGEVPGPPVNWKTATGADYAQLRYGLPIPAGRGVFLASLQPTADADLNASAPLAPAGIWKVELKNKSLSRQETVHAWIERGDTPYGYPLRGRQSYFDEPCYVRFDSRGRVVEEDSDPEQGPCHVKHAGLINSIATGKNPVVIAGLLRKEMVVPRYSAGGPILPPCGTAQTDSYRPDATTVSDTSRVHAGVLAAGSRSGSVIAMNGTSVAAPQVTRWIADRLAQGNPLYLGDRTAVQKLARDQEAAGLPAPRPQIPQLPHPRYGAGRIVLEPAVARITDTVVPRPRFVEI